MARQLIKGLVSNHPGEIGQLGQDTATEIKRDDSSTGVYKSDEGKVYAVDLTCTHMGCKANWDNAERTWDCPCHGPRFDYTGKVKYGPAGRNLPREEL